jgi:HEAT repeat protein
VPPTTLGSLIKDADSEVRMEAVTAAGRLKLAKTIPYLVNALSDSDTVVQEKAVLSLAEFGADAPLKEILHLLGSGRETLDYTIIRAVGKIGSVEAGDALIDFQREGDISRSIEFALIETLGRIGHKAASVMITTLYLNHGDSDFRRCAAQALGEIAAQDSLNAVRDACNDAHWSVRIASMEALVKIWGHTSLPVILEALNDQDQMVRKHAIQLLGNLRDIHAISKLVGLLTDPEMGKFAFESLLKVGRTVLPWLHRVMNGDYQLEVREMVIDLVGKIGDRKSIEPLIQVLDDPVPAIRLAALDSLVFCFDSLPLKKLSQVMQSDVNAEVRNKAFQAIQTLTSEKIFT